MGTTPGPGPTPRGVAGPGSSTTRPWVTIRPGVVFLPPVLLVVWIAAALSLRLRRRSV